MNNKVTQKSIQELAWENFCETGEIGAYLFYKKLSKGEKMANLLTKGVVLRAFDYGERDKIISLYTLEKGKVSVILKGVKAVNAKMKFAAMPFCFAEYNLTGQSDILTCIGVSEIESFYDITQDYDKIVAGSAMLEMCDCIIPNNGEANPGLFLQLIKALKTLSCEKVVPMAVTMKFALYVYELTGYKMQMQHCTRCGKNLVDNLVNFDSDTGEFVCANCNSNNVINISLNTLLLLRELDKIDYTDITKLTVNEKEISDFRLLLMSNFESRFGKLLKSLKN